MATAMKAWQVVCMDGVKTVKRATKFNVTEARELEKKYKEDAKAELERLRAEGVKEDKLPKFIVTRTWDY